MLLFQISHCPVAAFNFMDPKQVNYGTKLADWRKNVCIKSVHNVDLIEAAQLIDALGLFQSLHIKSKIKLISIKQIHNFWSSIV